MSDSSLPPSPQSPLSPPCAPARQSVLRLPVDKPQSAVEFLHNRGGGVMDLIAHFWERLAQTPPLLRNDLHLVVTGDDIDDTSHIDRNNKDAWRSWTGAMLYVPKAHRADVLALDPVTASVFANYIGQVGTEGGGSGVSVGGVPGGTAPFGRGTVESDGGQHAGAAPTSSSTADNPIDSGKPKPPETIANTSNSSSRTAIDFLTGQADGIQEMIPHLLPLVHKRAPARQMVNIVMQLPATAPSQSIPQVRLARDGDLPVLNRWRKAYKEERGILFDADLDAWVNSQRVYVLESEGNAVALAKLDLELNRLVEIGGVYTFPEFRKHGFGGQIVTDLAYRIRQTGKAPTLQVDRTNQAALQLYSRLGWIQLGSLARVWLTG